MLSKCYKLTFIKSMHVIKYVIYMLRIIHGINEILYVRTICSIIIILYMVKYNFAWTIACATSFCCSEMAKSYRRKN